MKTAIRSFVGMAIILLLSGVTTSAQFVGALHSARPLDQKTTDVGAYFGLFEGPRATGTTVTVFGQTRHGLFPMGDGGLKFGLVDFDNGEDDVGIILAADLQWALLAPRWGDRVWLSAGPEITMYNTSGMRGWGFAGNLSASYDFEHRGKSISPYGRLTIRLESIDYDNPKHKVTSELQVGLNPGVVWEISEFLDFVGELQLDDQFGFLAGLNFRI